jgi:hypothetical protein
MSALPPKADIRWLSGERSRLDSANLVGRLNHGPNDANRRMHFGKGFHRHIIMQHSRVERAIVEKVLIDNTRRFAGRQRV